MLTLLGSLLGFLSSTFPEFLKLFRDSQDRKHELAILDRQMEQQRLGHSQRLEEIRLRRMLPSARRSTATPTIPPTDHGWRRYRRRCVRSSPMPSFWSLRW